MKANWLIEADLFPEYAESLIASLRAQGHVAKSVPELLIQYRWQEVGCSYRSLFAEGECVVFHGSIGIASELQANNPWRPGVWFTRNNYDCSTYYCHFSCASLYACDVELVARDISCIAERQWAENATHGGGQ